MARSTARERFWARVQRRGAELTPPLRTAFLAAIAALRDDIGRRDVEAAIATGDVDRVLALAFTDAQIGAAFANYRAQSQIVARNAVAYFGRDIPGVPRGTIGIAFDVLDPRVLEAVRRLDTTMMQTLAADIRETVRATIRQGLIDGAGPRSTARALRDVIGLAPNQLDAVANFRRALLGEDGAGSPFTRELRDKRFDATIRRFGAGNLSPAQVDGMVAAYRKRFIAWNAETNARTATLDSLKLGQELAWKDAVAKGIIPEGALRKSWKGVMDERERPEHVAMEGETVPLDTPYSNGEMIPGESTFNCRCVSVIFAERG